MEWVALVIGKKNSTGVPGKNTREISGQPSVEYAFQAAAALGLEETFCSTDSPEIGAIAEAYGARVIQRPSHLALPDSLTEDVLIHAGDGISERLDFEPFGLVLMFANNPCISVDLVMSGIEALEEDSSLDSAFSVSRYDMFSPVRARRLSEAGVIEPFSPDLVDEHSSSIRSASGQVYFCDLAVQVIRWRVLSEMDAGMPPFKWQGRKSLGLVNDFGFDVDAEWQIPVVDYWFQVNSSNREKLLQHKASIKGLGSRNGVQ